MSDSLQQELQFSQLMDFEYGPSFYGTILGADLFFGKRLRQMAWFDADDRERRAALYEATEMVDRLNFAGCKTDESQVLQFPRGGDTVVPEDIEKATYEIAYLLLDGLDPDKEARQAKISSRSVAGMNTTMKNVNPSPFVTAGIYSGKAWSYLVPYLRDYKSVTLQRVD